MSLFVGARLTCDREKCGMRLSEDDEASLHARASETGWSRVDSRDFCPHHTEERAKRPKLADLLPGYRLMSALDAARAAGFVVGEEREDGTIPVTHCGADVKIESFVGMPYFVKCATCDVAIVDATGPRFTNATVSFIDSDKVDADDEVTWYVAGTEPDAAARGEEQP